MIELLYLVELVGEDDVLNYVVCYCQDDDQKIKGVLRMYSNLIVGVYYRLNVLYIYRLTFVGKFGGNDVCGV